MYVLSGVINCLPSFPGYAQILTCQVNRGMVPCPPVACPVDQVTITWTAPALVANNLWLLPSGSCSSSTTPDSIVLSQTVGACRGVATTCGPYTATNGDPGPSTTCLTSTLTVRVNTTNITSIMVGTQSVAGQIIIVNTTQIMTIGTNGTVFTCVHSQRLYTNVLSDYSNYMCIFSAPPGPPDVMAQTIGPDMVLVVVTPSPSGGLTTNYSVTVSNSSYTTSSPTVMTNGSAMVTFTGLRNDSSYTISAVAINCAGNSSTSYISCMYTDMVHVTSVCMM